MIAVECGRLDRPWPTPRPSGCSGTRRASSSGARWRCWSPRRRGPPWQRERIRLLRRPGDAAARQTGLKMSGLRQDGSSFPAEITLSALPTEQRHARSPPPSGTSPSGWPWTSERERLRAEAERERTERRAAADPAAGEPGPAGRRGRARLQQPAQRDPGLRRLHRRGDPAAGRGRPGAGARAGRHRAGPGGGHAGGPADPAAAHVRPARGDPARGARPQRGRARTPGQLLRRTLGEHIELSISPEPALWPVKADKRPARTGAGQPGRERAGRDAGWRAADHRHRQRRGRRDLRLRPARPGARPLHPAPGVRHRGGHGPGHRWTGSSSRSSRPSRRDGAPGSAWPPCTAS